MSEDNTVQDEPVLYRNEYHKELDKEELKLHRGYAAVQNTQETTQDPVEKVNPETHAGQILSDLKDLK